MKALRALLVLVLLILVSRTANAQDFPLNVPLGLKCWSSRPSSPVAGWLGCNSNTGAPDYYTGTQWVDLGGGGYLNVVSYGADASGVADSTPAFLAAFAAAKVSPTGNACVYVPGGGVFKISLLTLPGSTYGPNICLVGDGPYNSIIKTTSATGDVINMDAGVFTYQIKGVGFNTTGGSHRSSGSYVRSEAGWGFIFNVDFENAYYGIDSVDNVGEYDHVSFETASGATGLSAEEFIRIGGAAGGVVIDHLFNGAISPKPSACVHAYTTNNGSGNISNSDCLTTQNGFLADNTAGCMCGWFFANNHFDTGVNGISLLPTGTGVIAQISGVNNWVTAGTGQGFNFVTSAGTLISGVNFANSQANANSGNGAVVNGTSGTMSDISFTGGDFAGNGNDGIVVINVNAMRVVGVNAGAGATRGANGTTGISVNGGANAVVTGNTVLGNPTDIFNSASPAIVANNCTSSSCAASGVTSFNTRTGAVTLTGADITGAGGVTNPASAFFLHGVDNAGGTFPFVIQNLSGSNLFTVQNNGLISFNGNVAFGTATIGFYGNLPIVKPTPTGACAGNTGCQALRDALANLGLINAGGITN